jgi:RNA polymerase sigma-70 factor (ECF subfamily)
MDKQLNPEKWVNNYGDLLYAFALKRLNYNKEKAEDIVQDVFLKAWRSKETFNATASEKNWLMTICKNKLIDLYRKEGNTFKIELHADNDDFDFFESDGHFKEAFKAKQEWNKDASNHMENKEFYTVLIKCKSKLKQIQEQVFSMKYLDNIKTEEICELLGITNKNYWVLMHRAKIQLRTCLEKNWINA